jgi:hypothetical protein
MHPIEEFNQLCIGNIGLNLNHFCMPSLPSAYFLVVCSCNVFSGGSSAAFENTGSSTPMVLAEILELLLIGVSIGILSYGQLRLIYTSFYAI